jgi:hypothetical protein
MRRLLGKLLFASAGQEIGVLELNNNCAYSRFKFKGLRGGLAYTLCANSAYSRFLCSRGQEFPCANSAYHFHSRSGLHQVTHLLLTANSAIQQESDFPPRNVSFLAVIDFGKCPHNPFKSLCTYWLLPQT